MLNNTQIKTALIKLTNGDEIIASISDYLLEDDGSQYLFYPLQVIYSPTESDRISMDLLPWMISGRLDSCRINPQSIAAINRPTQELSEFYHKMIRHFLDQRDQTQYRASSQFHPSPRHLKTRDITVH
jgi:hypothetical protein